MCGLRRADWRWGGREQMNASKWFLWLELFLPRGKFLNDLHVPSRILARGWWLWLLLNGIILIVNISLGNGLCFLVYRNSSAQTQIGLRKELVYYADWQDRFLGSKAQWIIQKQHSLGLAQFLPFLGHLSEVLGFTLMSSLTKCHKDSFYFVLWAGPRSHQAALGLQILMLSLTVQLWEPTCLVSPFRPLRQSSPDYLDYLA